MAHTPGPWAVQEVGASRGLPRGGYRVRQGGTVYDVALIDNDGSADSAELKANARLIASAPDLLAALRALLDKLGGNMDAYLAAEKAQARAAIERAS